jgi:acyl-coenzyme A thioesterase PaaI-like protein
VLAPQLRGAGQIPSVSVPAASDRVAARLELEPGEHAAYTVALLEQSSGLVIWRSRPLKASAKGGGRSLGVNLSARLLRPGEVYVLRVTGVAAGGATETVGDYPFRVVKQ